MFSALIFSCLHLSFLISLSFFSFPEYLNVGVLQGSLLAPFSSIYTHSLSNLVSLNTIYMLATPNLKISSPDFYLFFFLNYS